MKPPNPFPPRVGESASDYAARLIAEGNAEAWLQSREAWFTARYRERVAAKHGEPAAARHMRRWHADAETFFAELGIKP